MKVLLLIIPLLIVLLPPSGLYGEMAAVLEEPGKVTFVAVDDQQLYVTDQTTIHIYSLKDFKHIKQFGKKGEGPQEFKQLAFVIPQKDRLLIYSLGKLSFWSKNGVFQNEKKPKGGTLGGFLFKPINDKFVAFSQGQGEDGLYNYLNVYDGELNKLFVIAKLKFAEKGATKMNLFNSSGMPFDAYGDRAYYDTRNGYKIHAVNEKGEIQFTIEQKDYKLRRFTDIDRKNIEELLKKEYGEAIFNAQKGRIEWPEYLPAVLWLSVDPPARKIVVTAWKTEKGMHECFIYSMEGKLEKRTLLPMEMNGILPFPFILRNGKLYQVIDNSEKERWELHITKLY